ncbi:DUF2147 domain-containing protein [Parerythrobacter lacustris]|uniref:DUF2147 domain-containing protein n=1 Tax=Parerythrobacter lacustris TaxID=2969984 RepID=A0ABT1XTR2_9SPHN|nr:DUF2147 domain-containing protein [Parerythrobacter lacustris]MCR2835017.1 DUF2147 domain-containing protein [Parerythrobacter lacustris]
MRLSLTTLAALTAFGLATPAVAAPASIAGKWKTDDGKSVISFYQCGSAMCGKIDRFLVAEPAGGARDSKNPKKDLRSRKLLGLRIFWDLKADKDSYEGKGYSPQDGRYFNADIRRDGNQLKVKGCVMVICRTVTWTRA